MAKAKHKTQEQNRMSQNVWLASQPKQRSKRTSCATSWSFSLAADFDVSQVDFDYFDSFTASTNPG